VQLYSKKARSQTKFFKRRHGVLEFVISFFNFQDFPISLLFLEYVILELELPSSIFLHTLHFIDFFHQSWYYQQQPYKVNNIAIIQEKKKISRCQQ
jgi:hypothetical protein